MVALVDVSGNGNDGTYYGGNALDTLTVDGLVVGDAAARVQDPVGTLATAVPCDGATFIGDFTIIGWYGDDGGSADPGADNAPAPTGTTTDIISGASTSDIQAAITAASSGTTLVFPAEEFVLTAQVALKTGVSLYGVPGAQLTAGYASGNNAFHANGVSNVNITGFICDGGVDGGGGTLNGFVFVDGHANNIRVEWNTFQNNSNQSDLFMYNSDNIYFRKNSCLTNEFQPVSMHRTEGTTHSNIFVTDNTITEYARMAIEALFNVQGEYHVDRNTISGQVVPSASGGGIAVSIVNDNGEGGGGTNQHGTIAGNNISGDTVGIECVLDNMTVKDNVIATTTGFFIGTCDGSVIENNTITSSNAFQEDGGYDGTEWIGTNTINGSSSTGWSGHGPYGFKPAVYDPSTPLGGGSAQNIATLLDAPGIDTDINASFDNEPGTETFAMTLVRIRDSDNQSLFTADTAGAGALVGGRHMLVYRYTAAGDNCDLLVDNVALTPSTTTPNPGSLADEPMSFVIGVGDDKPTTWDEVALVVGAVADDDLTDLWNARDDFATYSAKMLSLTPANYYHLDGVAGPPPAGPTVTAVVPASGIAAGGNTVIITGTMLTDVTSVQFDTTEAVGFTVDSDTQITATAPSHVPGIVHVSAAIGDPPPPLTDLLDSSGNAQHATYYDGNDNPTTIVSGLVVGDTASRVPDPGGDLTQTVPLDPATLAGDFAIIGMVNDGGGDPGTPGSMTLLESDGATFAVVQFSWFNDPTGDQFVLTLVRVRDDGEESEFSSFDPSVPTGRHLFMVSYTAATDSALFYLDGAPLTPSVNVPNPGALVDDLVLGFVGNGPTATVYDELAVIASAVAEADYIDLWDARDDFATFSAKMLSLTPANYYHLNGAT